MIASLAAVMAAGIGADVQNPPVSPEAPAQSPADAADLSKQLSNPVSSLISVPFQENVDFSVGPEDGMKSTLNIQPVVPVNLSGNWNVIIRTILPVVYQNEVVPASSQFGLGDITQSFFFSPSRPGPSGIIWGLGPVLLYPTATDQFLGGKKWGAGPTLVLLKQSGKDTFGILANHIWSVAGSNSRSDISATFLQPFYSHTTASALTLGLNSESSYDWKSKKWTVPINVTATQLTHMGKQPVSIGGGLRYYVVSPKDGPNWGVRLIFTLLFPKK